IGDIPTVGVRLGENTSTIDVDRDPLPEAVIAEAEDIVNNVIEGDLAGRAFFPTPEELRALEMRKAPKGTENIRVIEVGDFDVTPCGGTHCTHTAQVGLFRIVGTERYKGKTRIAFSAGRRSRKEILGHAEILASLGRGFTCRPADVPVAVDKLKR